MTYELPEDALPIGCPVRCLNMSDVFEDTVVGHVFVGGALTGYMVEEKGQEVLRFRSKDFTETEEATLKWRIEKGEEALAQDKAKLAALELTPVSHGEYVSMEKAMAEAKS